MRDKTGIEYLRDRSGVPGATWNPTTGCSPASEGCERCWARATAARFPAVHDPFGIDAFDRVLLHKDRLAIPLRWRRPRNVAVSFMGDLFHDAVPLEFIAAVYGVMAACPQHTFVVCTKRPNRAREWSRWVAEQAPEAVRRFDADPLTVAGREARKGTTLGEPPPPTPELRVLCDAMSPLWPHNHWTPWPLPNVVFLFSAENQARFDERVADALAVPAAVHGVSLEPLLGPVSLTRLGTSFGLQWVIAGCERPAHRHAEDAWFRSIRDQCVDAGVSFFLKQSEGVSGRVEKLPMLDGIQWTERPEVML